MSEQQRIGTCSLCGGDVMQYLVLWIVGPFPPPRCAQCGATEKCHDVIEMERAPPRRWRAWVDPHPSIISQQTSRA